MDELAASCSPGSDNIYLLAYSGLRWGEMAALKLKRVDLECRRFDAAAETLQTKHPELQKIRPHSLRHTAASLAISAGVTVLAVQRMLGHASAAMTLDVYSDLFEDDLDAVADALDARARSTDVGKATSIRKAEAIEGCHIRVIPRGQGSRLSESN